VDALRLHARLETALREWSDAQIEQEQILDPAE
jgi:hypothetical protein